MITAGFAPLAAVLLMAAAVCSSGPRSGIEGESVIGPTRPVARAGSGSPDQVPYPTTLLILDAADRHPVARLKTGPDGRFHMDLPPGEYLVTAASPVGRAYPRVQEERVQISSGSVVRITVRFDSGLR